MTSALESKNILAGAIAAAAIVASIGFASTASAIHDPEHYSLIGGAEYVTPGNASDRAVHLVSDATDPFSGISYGVEDDTTFAELTTLSTDYKLEADDLCVGGSPRFQIRLDTNGDGTGDANIFAYFGVDSAGAPCVPGTWQNTGDFLEAGRLLDTSQLPGGTFYDTYAHALATYGAYEITSITVVTDSSWAAGDSEHAVDIDNTLINSTLFDYEEPQPENADDCKNGGWEDFGFRNQGQCIRFVNTGQDSR